VPSGGHISLLGIVNARLYSAEMSIRDWVSALSRFLPLLSECAIGFGECLERSE
jgi:hypothetical protein